MFVMAADGNVRMRWFNAAFLRGRRYNVGLNMHGGQDLGGCWLAGNGIQNVAVHPHRRPRYPASAHNAIENAARAYAQNWLATEAGRTAHAFAESGLANIDTDLF